MRKKDYKSFEYFRRRAAVLFSSAKKYTQITLALILFLLAPSETFADDEQATLDALLLLAEGRRVEAIEQLEMLADRGNHFAKYELASLYLIGHFAPIDMIKHEAYFAAAAKAGNEVATYFQAQSSSDLGKLQSLLDQGAEIASCGLAPINPDLLDRCVLAIQLLASKGSQDGLFMLKVYLEDPLADELIKKFPHPSVLAEVAWAQWSDKPSKESLGQLVAAHELGSLKAPIYMIQTLSGEGSDAWNRRRDEHIGSLTNQTKVNLRAALRSSLDGSYVGWFGSEWFSNNALGLLYKNGNAGLDIAPDYGLAFEAFGNCASSESERSAGMCLYEQAELKKIGGPDLEKSLLEAIGLFQKASIKGNSSASTALAYMFRDGDGVPQNWANAAHYFEEAIEQGNFYVAYDLADIYRNGLGVDQDLERAASLYEASVAGDGSDSYSADLNAMLALADMHEAGDIDGAAIEEANRWFKKAMDSYEDWVLFVGVDSPNVMSVAVEGFERTLEKMRSLASNTAAADSAIDPEAYGSYVALVIANQAYQSLADLKTPLEDAALIGATFENRFGAQVEYLFDANRIEMLSALNRYRKELMPTDNFILYYAGHGIYDEELNIGYWQPVDSTVDEDYTWIDTDRISRTLAGFKSRNALVVADSCFSGSVVRGNEFASSNGNSSKALLALSAKKTRMAITSGGLQPVLDVAGNSQTSAFASNLVDVLNTVNGPVPISSLFPQIRSAVTAETAAWGFEQIPEMAPLYKAGHDGGDFILSPQIQASN